MARCRFSPRTSWKHFLRAIHVKKMSGITSQIYFTQIIFKKAALFERPCPFSGQVSNLAPTVDVQSLKNSLSLWGSWKKLKASPLAALLPLLELQFSLVHPLYGRHCRCSSLLRFVLSSKPSRLTLYNFARKPRVNQRNAINRVLIAILPGLSISNSDAAARVLLVPPAGADFLPLFRMRYSRSC